MDVQFGMKGRVGISKLAYRNCILVVLIMIVTELCFILLIHPIMYNTYWDSTTIKAAAASSYLSNENNNYLDVSCNVIQSCLANLGKNGTWVRDWDFARVYGQYVEPRVAPLGFEGNGTYSKFQPSDDAPFPWETSWRWDDYDPHCDLDYKSTVESFCKLLEDLLVDRIFMMGDSMTHAQFKSLVNKLGPPRNMFVEEILKEALIGVTRYNERYGPKEKNNLVQATLQCPLFKSRETSKLIYGNYVSHTRTIDMMFLRQSGRKGVKDGEMSFQDEVSAFLTGNRTLHEHNGEEMNRLVAIWNLGAHIHGKSEFKRAFDMSWKWFALRREQSITAHGDIWFYRTTPSGHGWCEPRKPNDFNFTKGTRVRPFAVYSEFIPVRKNSWELFDEYNEYAKDVIRTENMLVPSTPTFLLDVVNITLLRPDGHTGGNDCLHYTQPGPIDFWNHMLYSHLRSMRQLKQSNCSYT